MAPPPTRDSAVSPCFHGCPAFLHRHFPPQSPPSHPLDQSLHSPQQPSPWDCSTTPKLQLPATAPVRSMYGCARTVRFLFHLGCQRSDVSLSALSASPLTQLPQWGSTPASVPPPTECRSSPPNTLAFPPNSILQSFAWVQHSLLLVRHSCLLSAGVLHALLCLKVYS